MNGEAAGGGLAVLFQLAPFIILVVMFYFFIILPDKKRRKKYGEMLNTLKVNDEVMTKGGIMGKIVNIKDDYIVVESGPDKARLKMSKDSISTVNSSSEEIKEEK